VKPPFWEVFLYFYFMRNFHLIIILLFTQFLFGQTNYYLLPTGNDFNLYQKVGNDLEKLETLPFSYNELYAFDKNELVIVNNDSTKFHYGKIYEKKFHEEIKMNFPEKFIINTLELKDGYIFLGGNWDSGELFYVFDIKSKEFHAVPIPDEVYQPGKAIDDILFFEDKIIVVDNMIVPKYLIFYSALDLPQLGEGQVFKLPINGTYEHIYKGDINSEYLVLLSGTISGWVGSSDHISILKFNDLGSNFSISTKSDNNSFEYITLKDILLVNNRIYIAQKDKTLGILTIQEQYFKKSKNYDLRDYPTISLDKIKIHQELDNEPIKLLFFSEQKIIVITKDSKNQKHFQLVLI
jgi:hypothetical protein